MQEHHDTPESPREVIHRIYYESGLYKYFQENHPEMFVILVTRIIPAHQELEECKLEVFRKKIRLIELSEEIPRFARKACMREVTIHIHDIETTLDVDTFGKLSAIYWLSDWFNWFLKIGLTVVPILSLLFIAGIDLHNPPDTESSGYIIPFVLFSATALTWLSSSVIYNLVVSHKGNSRNVYLVSFVIWLSEALIGVATITRMIDGNILKRIAASGSETSGNVALTQWWEKGEIMLGVAVFALINILFSIGKAKVYLWSMPKRMKYAQARSDYRQAKLLKGELTKEIQGLEARLEELSELIVPARNKDYMSLMIQTLSNEVVSGRNYEGHHPGTYVNGKSLVNKDSES
jgi:hypothetical protein